MIKVITHDGGFHADDAFAIATMQLFLGKDEIEVIRSRDESVIESADYVIDVGSIYDHDRRRYDHHQAGAPVRENGIPYAAFGLVWRHYGEEVCGSAEVAEEIESSLCQQVDATDNGISVSEMNMYGIKQINFDSFVKTWQADQKANEDMDELFLQIVDICREYIKRKIAKTAQKIEDQKYALELFDQADNKNMIISDRGLSTRHLVDTEAKVLIMPDDVGSSGKWVVATIPVEEVGFEVKVRFPKPWAGLKNDELVATSGISGLAFCHKNLHLVIALTKEAALEAAKAAK